MPRKNDEVVFTDDQFTQYEITVKVRVGAFPAHPTHLMSITKVIESIDDKMRYRSISPDSVEITYAKVDT